MNVGKEERISRWKGKRDSQGLGRGRWIRAHAEAYGQEQSLASGQIPTPWGL